MPKLRDLTGQRFERLFVVKEQGRNKQGKAMWLCKCDCGNEKVIYSNNLLSGNTLSCGCLHKEKLSAISSTHKKCRTRLYKTWANMKSRCNNSKASNYAYYGDKGIGICNAWSTDFMGFYNWAIGNGYLDDLTIDRIEVDGNYEPSNCRWATMQEQDNNKTSNQVVTYEGKAMTIAQWSRNTGISYYALIQRLHLGWSVKRMLTTI